jgi:hypothetical protein
MIQQGALSGDLSKGFVKRYEKKADRAYNQYSNPSARPQWDNAGTTKPDERQMELYNSLNARDKGTRFGNMKKANDLEGVSLAYKMPNLTGQSKTLTTVPREKLSQVDMDNALGKKFERATSGSMPEEMYNNPTESMRISKEQLQSPNYNYSPYSQPRAMETSIKKVNRSNPDVSMMQDNLKKNNQSSMDTQSIIEDDNMRRQYMLDKLLDKDPMFKKKKYGGKMTYNGIKLK